MRFFLIATLVALLAGCASGPEDAVSRAERALAEGEPRAGFRALAPEAATHAENGDFHRLLASASLRTARISGAAAAAGRACELLPEDPRPYALKALAERRRSLVLLARDSAREAVRLAPDSPPYSVILGETLLAQGRQGTPDYEAARDAFRAALAADPENVQARLGLARALVHGDEHAEAAPVLNALLDEGLDFGEVRYLRGLVRLRARDFEGAADDFEWAARFGTPDPGVHFNRARALQRLGDRDGAEQERGRYEAARERDDYVSGLYLSYSLESGDVAVATELGRVLLELRRYEDAADILASLCFDQPKLPRPHVLWARAALGAQQYASARDASDKALALVPENEEALRISAQVAVAEERWEDAVVRARAAARGNGKDAWFVLIDALTGAGRYDEALAAIRDAGAAAPRHPRLDAARGAVLRAQGNAEGAERALDAALAQRPRRFRWLHERGLARLDRGDHAGARADFRAACDIAPHWPPPWAGLADALEAAGAPAGDARAAARRVRERDEEIRALRDAVGRDPWRIEEALLLAGKLGEAGLVTDAARIRSRALAWGPPV